MKIKNICYFCNGTGKIFTHDPYYPPTEITCNYCDGVGYKTVDIVKINEITHCPTSLILENTKGSEYIDLDDNKKAAYSMYISAGTLDMTVGTKAHDVFLLWIFPEGTVTHTAITNALNNL